MSRIQDDLNALLADQQVLYQKLRSFHWNVTGPLFFALHDKFEELYTQSAERIDALAERLRAKEARPLGTLREALDLSRLEEDSGITDPNGMVRAVADDFARMGTELRAAAGRAEEADDPATFNLLEGWADEDEKTLWMLRAYLAA
ncbi:MAG: DNA starvation/stationary phase protection protein [Planctomycetota bacterium]